MLAAEAAKGKPEAASKTVIRLRASDLSLLILTLPD
ncbi:hypothetical protein X793_01010 [Dehalococcoides mccartyi CG4]|nr:hypothetical protein X793_01010 [Dehalococcoides mccartyi CG4]